MTRWQRVKLRLGVLAATWTLVVALAGLAAVAGYLVAGSVGALVALGATLVSTAVGAPLMDRYVLRSMAARPLSEGEAPQLFGLLRDLARRAEVPMPRLWLLPSRRPNALTIGRDPGSASVAVSVGLLEQLDTRSMAGVLAHEVAHIRHRDILLQSFAASVTSLLRSAGRVMGLVVLISFPVLAVMAPRALLLWAVLSIAPMLALLLQMALSRQREFAADAEAARLTGDPEGLALALGRIQQADRSWLHRLLGRRGGDEEATPLSSHPPTAERRARLEAMGSWRRPAGAGDEISSTRRVLRPAARRIYAPIRVLPGHRAVPRVSSRRTAYQRAV